MFQIATLLKGSAQLRAEAQQALRMVEADRDSEIEAAEQDYAKVRDLLSKTFLEMSRLLDQGEELTADQLAGKSLDHLPRDLAQEWSRRADGRSYYRRAYFDLASPSVRDNRIEKAERKVHLVESGMSSMDDSEAVLRELSKSSDTVSQNAWTRLGMPANLLRNLIAAASRAEEQDNG